MEVAQAVSDWSALFRDADKGMIEAQLKRALADSLGRPDLRCHHASVHRWLYAQPERAGEDVSWDAARGLGICGDHCAAGRVESAWQSGTALAARILAG